MNGNVTFSAPWSKALIGMTVFSIFMLLGVPAIAWISLTKFPVLRWVVLFSPLLFLFIASLFMVRGYQIRGNELLVRRLGWSTRFDLGKLESATCDPDAFTGVLRVAGNGGLFAFAGLFRSEKLGMFRAYATDPHRSVVLRFADKTVVVTPGEPERFVEELKNCK